MAGEGYTVRFQMVQDAAASAAARDSAYTGPIPDSKVDEQQLNVQKKTLLQQIGIQLSLAAILKNSQIFTNTTGAIFQLLGGLIDIALAPIVPYLATVLRYFATQFPAYAAFIQGTMPRIISFVAELVQGGRNLLSAFMGMGGFSFSLFDKDGVSRDGRLNLSDLVNALGAAVMGAGLTQALVSNSQTVAGQMLKSMMQPATSKLLKFFGGIAFFNIIFSAINIGSIFKESGMEAGLRMAVGLLVRAILGGLVMYFAPGGILMKLLISTVLGSFFEAFGGQALSNFAGNVASGITGFLGGGGTSGGGQTAPAIAGNNGYMPGANEAYIYDDMSDMHGRSIEQTNREVGIIGASGNKG